MASLSDEYILTILTCLEDGKWHLACEVIREIGIAKNLRYNIELKAFQLQYLEFENLTLAEFMAVIKRGGLRELSFQKLRITDAGRQRLAQLRSK